MSAICPRGHELMLSYQPVRTQVRKYSYMTDMTSNTSVLSETVRLTMDVHVITHNLLFPKSSASMLLGYSFCLRKKSMVIIFLICCRNFRQCSALCFWSFRYDDSRKPTKNSYLTFSLLQGDNVTSPFNIMVSGVVLCWIWNCCLIFVLVIRTTSKHWQLAIW